MGLNRFQGWGLVSQATTRSDGIVELIDIFPTLCELASIKQPYHLQGKSFVPLMLDPTQSGKSVAFTHDTRGGSNYYRELLFMRCMEQESVC